jgi:tetratricopeptide (TPR) repeat protein/transcriptional regulator with XRE-family HTH domain
MKKYTHPAPRSLLRAERLRYQWSQQELANRLGISVVTINRWERGVTAPSPYFRLKLCTLFKRSAIELGLLPDEETISTLPSNPTTPSAKESSSLPSSSSLSSSLLWSVPLRRNPFFTGRDNLLLPLYNQLSLSPLQIYALCGLGGIGKTQLALEYAYRFRSNYQSIFWLRAETSEALATDCLTLARQLHLSAQNKLRPASAIAAIKHWLNAHQHWLLILDNVEDFSLVESLLPPFLTGHVLLTTRIQATGSLAHQIKLPQMTLEESSLLLLRRSKYLQPSASPKTLPPEILTTANAISTLLDGIPLALDQAGAYIEETSCTLLDYLERYRKHRNALLDRRGTNPLHHPASVVATISLCAEQLHAEAAELLSCCAFFHADNISEHILLTGAPMLGPILEQMLIDPLAMDLAIARLRAFSLLDRSSTSRQLSIHRLVQAVLRDRMSSQTKQQWAERITRATNLSFPSEISLENMPQCEQLLPQLDLCTHFISLWKLSFPEAGQLLQKAGHYLLLRGHHNRAETFLSDSLAIFQHSSQPPDLSLASLLNDLGMIYEEQGKYSQAETTYQQALSLREKLLAPDDPDLIETLLNTARLALTLAHYDQSEAALQHILSLQTQLPPSNHLNLIPALYQLANLHQQRGNYEQAEGVIWQAISICQQNLGETHPLVIEGQCKIALLYNMQEKHSLAADLASQIVDTLTRNGEADYYQTASSLRSLGLLYSIQEKYRQAEALLRQSIAICQRTFGSAHSETAESIRSLAIIYKMQGNYEQAVHLLKQASDIFANVYSPQHPDVAECQSILGMVYGLQGRYIQAQQVLQQAIATFTSLFGPSHPTVSESQQALYAIDSLQNVQVAISLQTDTKTDT